MYITKKDIDTYFQANWTQTPIQYEGAKFVQPKDGVWISISILPTSRIKEWTCVKSTAKVNISVLHTSVTDAFKLGDDVIAFLENIKINKTEVGTGSSDGFGVDDLGGTFRTVVTFNTYRSKSTSLPPIPQRAVTNGFTHGFA